ncbi:uncharacterized protein LOC134285020 [Aedes albopictus]|uniref:Peptidase A2 domain-containing protein n=1 Tax=Aedes albopictus TaxID=7160 RepID=A0ABM1YDK6_AEDAL
MSTFIGSVEPYVVGTSFSDYAERLQHVFNYNRVPEVNRKSLFITVSGAAVFSELKKLYPGTDLDTLLYNDIIVKLKNRFDKKERTMVQKALFYERCQRRDELAEDFILDVKLLAENCGFGVMRDSIIRDRLVLGAYDKKVRERLLEEGEPSLEETERILIAREQMARSSLRMEQTGDRVSAIERPSVHNHRDDYSSRTWDHRNGRREVYPHRSRRDQDRYSYPSRSRSRSGQRWRSSNAKSVLCSYCKIRGHVRKNCFKLQRSRQSIRFVGDDVSTKESGFDFKRLGQPNNISDSEEDLDCMSITVGAQVNKPVFIHTKINGLGFDMEMDSGSAVSVVGEQIYRKHFYKLPLKVCRRRLSVVDGARLEILGVLEVTVSMRSMIADVT